MLLNQARKHLMHIVTERSKLGADTQKVAQVRGTLAMLLAALGHLDDALVSSSAPRPRVAAASHSGGCKGIAEHCIDSLACCSLVCVSLLQTLLTTCKAEVGESSESAVAKVSGLLNVSALPTSINASPFSAPEPFHFDVIYSRAHTKTCTACRTSPKQLTL